MNLKIKLGLTSILLASSLFAGTFNVDTVHSNVAFKVKHMMISNVTGEFDKFSGSFEYNEKTKKVTSLSAKVDVNSINTNNVKRDGHLKSADFFDAAQFPNITYTISKIMNDEAHGEITIHGITKKVVFDFENNGMIVDPWGNTRIGLELSGSISRKAFGLKWNNLLEAGGAIVGDKIKLNIELEGVLAK